jgi:hypothetical protein
MWWHTVTHEGGEVKGKLANGVGSQYPSHYLGTLCTANAHTSAASSRMNWCPCRLFRRKTKSGSCACAITFQKHSTSQCETHHCDRIRTACLNNFCTWRTCEVRFVTFFLSLLNFSCTLEKHFSPSHRVKTSQYVQHIPQQIFSFDDFWLLFIRCLFDLIIYIVHSQSGISWPRTSAIQPVRVLQSVQGIRRYRRIATSYDELTVPLLTT